MEINFCTQLQYYLKLKKMSVNQLADKTGISQSYLNDLVTGKRTNPGILKVDLIVTGLGTTIPKFFTPIDIQQETLPLSERIEQLPQDKKELIDNVVTAIE